MKLSQFLAALTDTNVQVTLYDLQTSAEIISLKASGYASLEDTIENREVKQWSVLSPTAVKVVLGDALV